VAISTGSALATGLVFFAATLPNLLLSPIAGTFVDRWDHKEVMVVSDILRGAIVLILPLAAVTNIILVYPLIFLVTSISVFFRPARVAILPQIVPEEDLLSANSAMWVGETIADVIGYPLAGLFVVLLGTAVPLAFWVDSATYLASAALLATIVVPRAVRATADASRRPDFVAELAAGWQFLRHESVLLANTLQGTVGQFSLGLSIALTPSFVQTAFPTSGFAWQASYGFLETGIGLGNLIGGFAVGLVGTRFAKGRMVIAGYALWGLLILLFALSNNLGVAIGLAFGQGVANMIFVIPSQTLFQERTPAALMGRVVGFRFALVFGSMTIAMLLGSVLGQVFGPGPVMAAFGLVTVAAGLAGLLVSLVRLGRMEFNTNESASRIQTTDAYVQDAIETIAKRAELIGDGTKTGDFCRAELLSKADFWQAEAQNNTGGRTLTYTEPYGSDGPKKGTSVKLLHSPGMERWEEFTCLNSLREVEPLGTLLARTENSVYRLIPLEAGSSRILIQGGRFFPEPTEVRFAGSGFGGSFL
jgi:MFS family permease